MKEMARTLNILGVEYTIQEVDIVCKEDPRRGEVNFLTNTIKLDKNMPNSLKNRTLTHEILHAMFDSLGMYDLRDDESRIQAIATAVHQIFSSQDVFEKKEETK